MNLANKIMPLMKSKKTINNEFISKKNIYSPKLYNDKKSYTFKKDKIILNNYAPIDTPVNLYL